MAGASRTFDSQTRRLSSSRPDDIVDLATDGSILQIGGQLGRYVILRRIGEGGMGVVYEANDPGLGRNVAVKVLWPARRSARRIERLRREARAMAKISHPNVVQVFDVGTVGDQAFLAMEFVRGRNLTAWLDERPRAPLEIVSVMTDVARGLAAAHAAGLVHRDVKAGNILVDERGRALIGDFGIAHAGAPTADGDAPIGEPALGDAPDVSGDPGARGAGTPTHMAPEQHVGEAIDARTDQFGFGVTMWHALFGELPFDGRDLTELYCAKLDGPPTVPHRGRHRTAVPSWIVDVCVQAMAAAPERRFDTTGDLIAALQPRRRRRRAWLAGGATIATIAAIAGVATTHEPSACDAIERELAQTWSSARASRIDAVVDATGAWLAPSWTTARARIDEWAAQWIAVRESSCRTNPSATDDDLDATHACLRQRRSALETVLDLVEQGDAAVLDELVASISAVPSPRACEDIARAGREPQSVEARRRVQAADESLARAETLGRAGRHADGLAIAARAEAEADELDWPPLRARAIAVRGMMLRGLGQHERAHEVLESAHHLAQELGDDALALSTATSLTSVVGWDRARVDEGVAWARHGAAALMRSGGDSIGEAALLEAEGIVLRRGARYDEAREKLERARDLWQAATGQELKFASTLGQLAGLEIAAGRLAAARASYQSALDIKTALLGPEHPALATTLGGIAIVDHMTGDNASAKVLLERAIALRERTLGASHPQLAGQLNNLGIVLLRLGDGAAALDVHHRALAIRERSLDPDHADIAESLNNIGVVLQEQQRHPEAEVVFYRALTIHERTLGPDHPSNVGLLDNLGIVAREQGQLDAAERWHRRALDLASARLGERHVGTANASLGLAAVFAARERCGDALRLLEQAETIYADSGAEPSRRAEAMFLRGRCIFTTGDRERGRALVEDAHARFEALGSGGVRARDAAAAWLREHGA